MYFAFIGNIGSWEMLLILLVALIAFGPGKLPEVAKTIGKTLGEIKRVTSGVQKEFQDAINLEADVNDKKPPAIKRDEKDDGLPRSNVEDISAEEGDGAPLGINEEKPGKTDAVQPESGNFQADAAEMKS